MCLANAQPRMLDVHAFYNEKMPVTRSILLLEQFILGREQTYKKERATEENL